MSDTSDAHVNTSGWLPISQAPKDGTRIIALLEGKRTDDDVMVVRWLDEDKDGEAGWWDDYGCTYDVSWWIPMPEKAKKRHFCEGPNKWVCESIDGLSSRFILKTHEGMWISTPYCPFCGDKS